jgi:ABC-2 type transport system permease protein
MFGFIAFFYCLGAMFEERRDRSILFWKSLPVSDQMTVLSKVAMALIVAPLISIAVGIAISFVMLFMLCLGLAFHGMNYFGLLLSNPDFYLAPLRLIAMWPIYVLWAVPTVGWLLMVSAWARSKVFLWAVGAPIISLVIAKMADAMFHLNLDIGWFATNVIARILVGLFPGAWTAFDHMTKDGMLVQRLQGSDLDNMFTASWMSLGSPSVWVGVVAGVSIKLRRWRDEG